MVHTSLAFINITNETQLRPVLPGYKH